MGPLGELIASRGVDCGRRGRRAGRAALRAFGAAGLALWGLVSAPGSSPGAPAPPRAERVVLVTIDTLRADHVGAYGSPVATPALDALAAEGALVEQACTPVPSTGPAHASLLTGLYPWRHGTLTNGAPLDPRLPTLASRLREQGFATAAFVSSTLLDRRFGFDRGFDHFSFEPTEPFLWAGRRRERFWSRGGATVAQAMRWITAHAGQRFFVWVHLFDPHTPYDPPPGFRLSPELPVSLERKSPPEQLGIGSRQLRERLRAYRGEIAYADAQLAKLVERLRLLELLEGTALLLTSDHGEGLGDHGLLEHGRTLFDELVRVPLLVRAPGVPAGRRLAGDAQLEDLTPTVLSLVGAEVPSGLDGLDLSPWLRGEAEASPRPAALGRRRPSRQQRDLFYWRAHPSKWIGTPGEPGRRFDLAADPNELGPGEAAGAPAELLRALEAPDAREPASEAAGD